MTAAEQFVAGEDLLAYIRSLDAAETVGELAHLGDSVDRLLQKVGVGLIPPQSAFGALSGAALALAALGQHLATLTDEVTSPAHDGTVHSCILIGRVLGAGR